MPTLTAQGAAINRTFVDRVLTMRATVWSRTANTGPFNLAVKTGLACRLDPVNREPAATNTERRELANTGTLRWDATYELPETGVQIEVDAFPGKRWNPIAATAWPDNLPGIGIIGRSCDVVRAT